jgi:hypothetical protein
VPGWAAKHPLAEKLVSAIGFHSAYSSPLFLFPTALLIVSTAVCSWRRTSVARGRLGFARARSLAEAQKWGGSPRFELDAGAPDALDTVAETLRSAGLRVRRFEGGVVGSTGVLGTLGSPVFHWSLVLLFAAIILGRLSGTSGLVGIPVGTEIPDSPASYGLLNAAPLHRWDARPMLIAVPSFRLYNVIDGLDRGPTPHVVLKSADGAILAQGDVYPNSPLRLGTVIVHPSAYGFAVGMSVLDSRGSAVSTATMLLDLGESSNNSAANGSVRLFDAQGSLTYAVGGTIALDKTPSGYFQAMPRHPVVRFLVRSSDGGLVAEKTLSAGQRYTLPDGTILRLDSTGYYSRLSVVDDSSITAVYSLFLIATLAVAAALLLSQTTVIVGLRARADGADALAVWARDWRGRPNRLAEIERELRAQLQPEDERHQDD